MNVGWKEGKRSGRLETLGKVKQGVENERVSRNLLPHTFGT